MLTEAAEGKASPARGSRG